MPFKTSSSERLVPMVPALSWVAGIGAIAIVLAMKAAISSSAATTSIPSFETAAPVKTASLSIQAARTTEWRWGKEDGVYYIEYNWQPRNKVPAIR